MITCAYCCHECPDNAQLCPKCGKPIFRLPLDDTPNYDDIAKELLRENDKENTACAEPLAKAEADAALIQAKVTFYQDKKEPLSPKQAIITACVVLLLALVAYSIFVR